MLRNKNLLITYPSCHPSVITILVFKAFPPTISCNIKVKNGSIFIGGRAITYLDLVILEFSKCVYNLLDYRAEGYELQSSSTIFDKVTCERPNITNCNLQHQSWQSIFDENSSYIERLQVQGFGHRFHEEAPKL